MLLPLFTALCLPFFGCVNGHDWAIVELEVPIAFSDRVQPICLPTSPAHQKISDGTVLTVTSWGRRDAFHKGDPLIHEIPLRHDSECKGRPWTDTMPTDVEDYLCAKALNPKDYHSARTCHGDSGSGMEWKKTDRRNTGTAPQKQNATTKQFLSKRPQIEPQFSPIAALSSTSSLLFDKFSKDGSKANGNVTQRIGVPSTEKRAPVRENRRKSKIHVRNVLRSPLIIPQLELMKKWRNSRRKDEKPRKEALASQRGGDELVKLLLSQVDENGTERRPKVTVNRSVEMEDTSRTELIGVTSYGSPQCGSDELARFTRMAHYVRKICALIGVCYQLD